jgi:hypothetical protein
MHKGDEGMSKEMRVQNFSGAKPIHNEKAKSAEIQMPE